MGNSPCRECPFVTLKQAERSHTRRSLLVVLGPSASKPGDSSLWYSINNENIKKHTLMIHFGGWTRQPTRPLVALHALSRRTASRLLAIVVLYIMAKKERIYLRGVHFDNSIFSGLWYEYAILNFIPCNRILIRAYSAKNRDA